MQKEMSGQKKVVWEILLQHSPMMTQTLKIEAMKKGISCGSRYLRWLQEDGLIFSYKKMGNKTKTWAVMKKPAEDNYQREANGQLLCIT